jgi:endogenous inhibitor of DNA gyrase (YacG/DUF329 family)
MKIFPFGGDRKSREKPASPAKRCAICMRRIDANYDPFCSRRCAEVDLYWLAGTYAISGAER